MQNAEHGPVYAWFSGLGVALALGLILIAFSEALVRLLVHRRPVSRREVSVNLGMWLVELVLRTATGSARWAVFTFAAAWAPWTWNVTPVSAVLLFLAVDFFYYSRHRLLHSTKLGWALHAPHHSSVDLTITSALRLGWVQRVLDDFFYVPLVLLGAPPLAVFIAIELNHASQLWCHTETIGRLRWLDGFLNTPSNHRVHHARDRAFADTNFGATFMWWDRLLGTYRREPGPLLLGWSEPYAGVNPFVIQFRALAQWLRSNASGATTPRRLPPTGARAETGASTGSPAAR